MTNHTHDKARAAYWRRVLLINPARKLAALRLSKICEPLAGSTPGPVVGVCNEANGGGLCGWPPFVVSFIYKPVSRAGSGVVTALGLSRERVGAGFTHNFPASAKYTNDNFAALRKL